MRRLKSLFKNFKGLVRSLVWLIGRTDTPRVFFGYWHFVLAKKYAHKRFNKYSPKMDQLGKSQGIFIYSDEALIVISAKEIKFLKKKGVLPTSKWYKKIFNRENIYKVAN